MRGTLWLLISLLVSVVYCDGSFGREKRSELFPYRSPYAFPGTQILAGVVDIAAGGVSMGVGAAALGPTGGVSQAARSYDQAKRSLREWRELFENDPRLKRMAAIRQLLNDLAPHSHHVESCHAQVVSLTRELETLAAVPTGIGPRDNRSEGNWLLHIEAAEDALNSALLRYRIQFGKASILIIGGGVFLAQVGTRLWIFNYHHADPGLAPNAVLGYEYGLKPVFRLIKVLDDVEWLFTGEARTPQSEPEPERDEYERSRRAYFYGGGNQ